MHLYSGNSNSRLSARMAVFFAFCVLLGGGIVHSATGSFAPAETHQTIEGFGGSAYYYDNWLTAHPYKEDIYYYMFEDLGTDILRFGNQYGHSAGAFNPHSPEIAAAAEDYLGHPVKILFSSWSPPAYLKSNNSTKNGGTLVKKDGHFDYAGYGQYWAESLDAYEELGIVPEYVSIQNEPGYVDTWETCELLETEKNGKAGYDSALNAVYDALQARGNPPKLLASEVLGIGYNLFQNYARYFNHDQVFGYAHHLYHGGDPKHPDAFLPAMKAMASGFGDKPRFQTEYSNGDADWLNTAWIMHNSLVYEEVSAYLHWGLMWPGDNELVKIDNPWNSSGWETSDGFSLTGRYYAFRQFSKFIDPGWKRITADVDSKNIRLSAYISADGDSLTAVILNVSQTDESLSLDLGGYQMAYGSVIRTSETEFGEDLGAFDPSSPLDVPARSITTICMTGQTGSAVGSGGSSRLPGTPVIQSIFPNPFNPSTVVCFYIPASAQTRLVLSDLRGREIRTFLPGALHAGQHSVQLDGSGLASGVYVLQLRTNTGLTAGRKVCVVR
ncbi:T9SS type A sorting domain-containing protein [bacterium]|nr:T9SS type A sorting domain-containing protein [bacterium]